MVCDKVTAILYEISFHPPGEAAAAATTTATGGLMDSMDLSAMPAVSVQEDSNAPRDINAELTAADLQLLLFPSQIHKISSLIALMAHFRDLLHRIQVGLRNELLSDWFWWLMAEVYVVESPSDGGQYTCCDKSTLVLVMAWCRQATSHYPSQCCPRSLSPYVVTRPEWVNSLTPGRCCRDFKCKNILCIQINISLWNECWWILLIVSQHWFS